MGSGSNSPFSLRNTTRPSRGAATARSMTGRATGGLAVPLPGDESPPPPEPRITWMVLNRFCCSTRARSPVRSEFKVARPSASSLVSSGWRSATCKSPMSSASARSSASCGSTSRVTRRNGKPSRPGFAGAVAPSARTRTLDSSGVTIGSPLAGSRPRKLRSMWSSTRNTSAPVTDTVKSRSSSGGCVPSAVACTTSPRVNAMRSCFP